MHIKKWLRVFFFIFFTSIFVVALTNYFIDPMLNFNNSNTLNHFFKDFNERTQKTNYIFNTGKQYNGILLGSSRTTYINQNDFIKMNVFNYGLSNILPYEYKPYIDFFKLKQGKNLDYIIIGVDFYGTNEKFPTAEEPSEYINKALYDSKYKMLLSMDNLKYSLSTIKTNLAGKYARGYYDHNMIKMLDKVGKERFIHRFRKTIVIHTYEFSQNEYSWDKKYFTYLMNLKNENPQTKFIIFTPPISADTFVSIIKKTNRFKEYSRWIRGLVDIFGEIYCFMDINSITTNLENYPDDNHFYPYVGKILANKISTDHFDSEPKDFGVKVNKDNVEDFLNSQLKKIERYEFSEFYPEVEIDKKLGLN